MKRSELHVVTSSSNGLNDDSNIGNESDSDADYDDLDDLALPSDNDDFIDDDVEPDEDDKSVHSTATTVSDSSACSNTPSLVGESLETSSVTAAQDTAPRKHAWVSQAITSMTLKSEMSPNHNCYFLHSPRFTDCFAAIRTVVD